MQQEIQNHIIIITIMHLLCSLQRLDAASYVANWSKYCLKMNCVDHMKPTKQSAVLSSEGIPSGLGRFSAYEQVPMSV